jgi:hypothetical protein
MDHGKKSGKALKASRTAARVLAAWCCVVALWPSARAAEQPSKPVRCSYEPRSDITTALQSLQAKDEKSRLAAAATLAQIGKDALPALMAAIPATMQHDAQSEAWPQKDAAIALAEVMRAILAGDRQAILRFRQCTTDAIIKPLVWASRGDNQRLRVSSANILANVVDNTTVCFVLHHLRDAGLSASGRANLLGVTNSMASYAYEDNVASISKTMQIVNTQIGTGAGLDQTRAIIGDISGRIERSENKGTSLQTAGLKEYCTGFKFDDPLN